ncbi:MAG TPA: hypothetical protein VK079_03725 [Bacillota bacterium]|nr:hypothetical protein [Bacillota bacterium]
MARRVGKILFYLALICLIVIIGDDETRHRLKAKIGSLKEKSQNKRSKEN